HRETFEEGSGVTEDDLAGRGFTGEGDEGDVRVLDQRITGVLTEPVDEVEDPSGQSGFFEYACPQRGRERSELRGLEHDGVPRRRAGPSFHDSSMNGVFHGVMSPA